MGAIVFLCISYAVISFVIIKKSNFFARKLIVFREKQKGVFENSEEMLRKYEVSISMVGYILLGMSVVVLVCVLLFRLIVL